MMWFLLFLLLPSEAQVPSPESLCENVTDPNNWKKIFSLCIDSKIFGTDKVWDWSSVPSSFDLMEFLNSKNSIRASIRMVNTNLEYVIFPKFLMEFGLPDGTFEISENKGLFSIQWLNNDIDIKGKLILRNNRRLNLMEHKATVKRFKNNSLADPYGECHFKTISNLTDGMFKYCRTIVVKGDLVIEGRRNFLGTNSFITRIEGCLIVRYTQLTSLDFLRLETPAAGKCIDVKGSSEISNNKNLCISRPILKNLSLWFPGITISNNDKCSHICTSEEAVVQKIKGCTVLFGDLVLPNTTTKNIPNLESVEELNGRLIIDGTQFESIQFLRNLKVIYSESIDPTVFVKDNAQLHTLNFKSLKTVASPADLILLTTGNQRLLFTIQEHNQWKGLAHGQILRIRVRVEKEKADHGYLRILGIIMVIIFALIYVAFYALSVLSVRPEATKKKKE